jgi:hypothetical protein
MTKGNGKNQGGKQDDNQRMLCFHEVNHTESAGK